MLIALIFIIGEVFSILSILYVDYFGTPERLFRKYDKVDGCLGLYMAAILGGWFLFPFFIYVIYEQINMNKQ